METQSERNCPACGSPNHTSRGVKNGFLMLTCKNCRTLYTAQLPNEENQQNYDEYYNPNNLSAPDFVHQRLDEIVAGFAPYKENNRLIDVGCGGGFLLQAAHRAGWDVKGLEVSPPAVKHLQDMGLDVRCQFLEEAKYPDDYFDVVTACGVLEHVPEVEPFTREIVRILRPGGLFYATTPNGVSGSALMLGLKWSTVSPPEHLQLFSISGMKKFLARCGLQCLKVVSEGANPYEIMYAFRNRRQNTEEETVFNRVEAAYSLNESFTKSPYRRFLKDSINSVLHLSRMGDELKIYATK